MLKQQLRVKAPPLPAEGWSSHSSVLDWLRSHLGSPDATPLDRS